MKDIKEEINLIIEERGSDSIVRIRVIAEILRDLLEASGEEAALAFTLVFAEFADEP